MTKRSTNFGGKRTWAKGFQADNILTTMRALGMTDDEIKASLTKMQEQQAAEIELCAPDKNGEFVLMHGAKFTADELAQYDVAIKHYGIVPFQEGMRVRWRNVTKQQIVNLLSKAQDVTR
jgi:hypothetical protein